MKILKIILPVILIVGALVLFLDREKPKEQDAKLEPMIEGSGEISRRDTPASSSNRVPTVSSSPEDQITSLWSEKDFEEITRIYGKWIFESPEAAIDFVAELAPPMNAAHFSPDIKLYFDTLPPQEVMALTLKLKKHHQVQESVSAEAFGRWLGEDPETPVDWLFEHQDQIFTEALSERVGCLGHFGEPSKALGAILEREKGPLQSSLIKGVLMNWLQKDEAAAIVYMNEAEASTTHDEVIMIYANGKISSSPVAAMVWAKNIEKESLRNLIISQIKPNWTEEHEAQYQEAIAD